MDEVKKKILLVEDDVALSTVYKSRLELEGFETHEVNNGEDALSAALEYKPDLIVLAGFLWQFPASIIEKYPNRESSSY